MSTGFRSAAAAALALLAVACAQGTSVPSDVPAAAPRAAVPAVPAVTDEARLRAAIARAQAEQRFHSPAGNNALEGYLALRTLRPDDADLAIAMMEMLPYAVIASEQAMARADFAEARRLADLIARADPQAPALPRLRHAIAAREAAEADEAKRMIAEADAARRRAIETGRLAAEAGAPGPAPAPAEAGRSEPPPPTPAALPPAASPAPTAARASSAPRPAAPSPAPTLISSPSPRYPVMALRRRLEGDVTVAFTVRSDGSVGDARVIAATPPDVFDEAALAAVSRWRFAPADGTQEVRRVLQFRLPRSEG